MSKKFFRFSLKNKLTLSIVLIITFFGAMATYAVFLYAQDTFLENEIKSLELSSSDSANDAFTVLNNSKLFVEAISRQPDIVNYLNKNPKPQDEKILNILRSYNSNNAYSAIYLLDASGNTLTSTAESFVGKNYSFREYFKQAKNDKPSTDVAVGVTSKELGYYFSAPIKDKEEIIGVAVLKMIPGFINKPISFHAGLDSHVMFVDDHGVILYSDVPERKFKSLGNLDKTTKQLIEEGKRFTGVDITPMHYNVIQKDIANIIKYKVFENFCEGHLRLEILSVTKVDEFPFFLIIGKNAEIYTRQAWRVAIILGIFVISAALTASLMIYILIARFLKPLEILGTVMRKISSGNLEQRINLKTGDEIEDLGKNLNKMSSQLLKSRQNIESKIKERTLSLERINKFMVGRELKMIELKKEILKLKKQLEEK